MPQGDTDKSSIPNGCKGHQKVKYATALYHKINVTRNTFYIKFSCFVQKVHNFNFTLQHFILLSGVVKVGHTGAYAPPSFQKPFSTDLTPQINSLSEINDTTI